jgi:hypothetical protein
MAYKRKKRRRLDRHKKINSENEELDQSLFVMGIAAGFSVSFLSLVRLSDERK